MHYISNPIDSVTVGTTAAASEEIIYSDRAGGRFQVPAGSSITSITWYDAPKSGGTFVPASDEYGGDQQTSMGKSMRYPRLWRALALSRQLGTPRVRSRST